MSHSKFESPYIEWHLSEILAPVILNDKRLKEIIGEKSYGYEEHEKIKIEDKTVPKFFEDLDYHYDANYGTQELDGIVWLEDGTWLERGEYDGSEWWEHTSCPEIPPYLSNIKK